MSGRLEFENRTGARQLVQPGDVLLAEDTTGGGSTLPHCELSFQCTLRRRLQAGIPSLTRPVSGERRAPSPTVGNSATSAKKLPHVHCRRLLISLWLSFVPHLTGECFVPNALAQSLLYPSAVF
jgi:hypothetical protein